MDNTDILAIKIVSFITLVILVGWAMLREIHRDDYDD